MDSAESSGSHEPLGSSRSVREEMARLRRSSRNRESQDELTTLESALRQAYVAKELQLQITEREVEKYIESVRSRVPEEETRIVQQASVECDLKRRSEREERSAEYRRQLEEQMTRKREERRLSAEEARVEREILREVDRIREESERSRILQRKQDLMESSRRAWFIQREMKEIQKERDWEVEAMEFLRDQQYSEDVDKRNADFRKVREEQAAKRERVLKKVADMIIRPEIERRERESLINDLVAEDIRRELCIKDYEEKVRREKLREELVTGLEEQILFTEECKLRFLERDRLFAEEVMRKIMEDERTERLTSEARRRLQIQYREDLVKLMEERRETREREIARMAKFTREARGREEARIQNVKAERKRLLAQHAPNIANYINPAMLTADERAIIENISSKVDSRSSNSTLSNTN